MGPSSSIQKNIFYNKFFFSLFFIFFLITFTVTYFVMVVQKDFVTFTDEEEVPESTDLVFYLLNLE